MNILFFSERIIYGGGEKVRNWLAGKLKESGHNVIYASPNPNNKFYNDLEKVGLKGRVIVDKYPFHIKKSHPIKYKTEIKNLYQRNEVDLLIYFGGSLIEQVIARSCGVKVLLSERCEPASRPIAGQILKQIQYRFADGYVFQTPEAALCYGKRAKALSVVIPNPIIDKLPVPILTNLRKEIVTVGRLSKEKNQLMLIDAFAKFHNKYSEYKLIIYGSGPLEKDLNEAIIERHISECAQIIKGKHNISELINGAELFVLPSNTEGMPNALIEAMSVGIQCISTNCPIYGPKMLVEHGVNGYLTPIKNADALYDMMCHAIENKEQANLIRKNAVQIRERLDESKIAKRWIEYIEKLVNNYE